MIDPGPPGTDSFRRFSDEVRSLVRTVLIIGLGIGAPTVGVLIFLRGPTDPVIRYGYPPLLVYLLTFVWVLWRRPRSVIVFSRFSLGGIAAAWLASLAFRLLDEDLVTGWKNLFPTTVMGFVVFVVVGFLVFPVRGAVVYSAVVDAAVAAVGTVALLHNPGGTAYLVDLYRYCVYLVVISVLLYVLSRSKARVALAFEAAQEAHDEAHEMRDMAYRDPLTAIANRRRLVEELAHQATRVDRLNPVSIVYFDLDHFKEVNDAHGHTVGDQVLCAVAHIASTLVRQQDVVARVGGEEFVIVTPGIDGRDAAQLAERLRTLLPPAVEMSVGFPVTASFGVAMLRPEDNALDALGRVDALMYAAKSAGRDRVVYIDT